MAFLHPCNTAGDYRLPLYPARTALFAVRLCTFLGPDAASRTPAARRQKFV